MPATAKRPQTTPFAHPHPRRRSVGLWVVAVIYGLTMMGGTLPLPLYRYWSLQMHFGSLATTLIFAAYTLGVVVSLLLFAAVSDRLGRRPVLIAALTLLMISTVIFLSAHDLALLLLARFIFGVAAGVVTATANAALTELAGHKRSRLSAGVSTAANMGGLALGALVAGLITRGTADPTQRVFRPHLLTLVAAMGALLVVPETVARRGGPRLEIRRPTMPSAGERNTFWRVLLLIFAAFAMNGLFSSLVPAFLRTRLHVTDVALTSAAVSVIFFAALTAQLLPRPSWMSGHTGGPLALVVGVVVLEGGLLLTHLSVFLVGTLIAGAGIGSIFRRGITITQRLAAPERRADLLATYFLAAYLGTMIPTITLGVLDQQLGTNTSTLLLAAAVVTLVAVTPLLTPRSAGSISTEEPLSQTGRTA